MYEQLNYEVQEHVAIVTLTQTRHLNTLTFKTFDELDAVAGEIQKDPNIRAAIITGGEDVFCAGDNVKDKSAITLLEAVGPVLYVKHMQDVFTKICNLKVPVIAAVAGYALGGGCELALSCDFIIASENAQFGLPESKLGVMPCIGGTQRMPRRVSIGIAKEMMFTSEFIDAQRAVEIGLANRVVAKGNLLEEALKTANKIAKMAPISNARIKASINAGLSMSLNEGIELEAANTAICMGSKDAMEGIMAFSEKRDPNFKNK